MSLLGIVKATMDSNGWPTVTSSVSASQDPNMRQCFALANKALWSACFKKPWPVLTREHVFKTVGGQSEYPLPDDFHHLVVPSAVNANQYYSIKGSLSPIQWYRYALNGGINWAQGFRIDPFSKNFIVAPTPSSPEDLMLMYITKFVAKDASDVPVERYSQDSDMSLLDEDLIEMGLSWRWRQKKGLDFTAEMAEYNGTLNQRFAQQVGSGEFNIGARPLYDNYPLTQPSTPAIFGP